MLLNTQKLPFLLFNADKGNEGGTLPTDDGKIPEPITDDGQQTTFPAEYVKELRSEAAKYRTQLREIEAEREKAERESAEKRGEFEELYNTANLELATVKDSHTALQAQFDEQSAVLEKLYKERADVIPEHFQELLEKMPVVKRLEWLTANADKLNAPSAVGTPSRTSKRTLNAPNSKQPHIRIRGF